MFAFAFVWNILGKTALNVPSKWNKYEDFDRIVPRLKIPSAWCKGFYATGVEDEAEIELAMTIK